MSPAFGTEYPACWGFRRTPCLGRATTRPRPQSLCERLDQAQTQGDVVGCLAHNFEIEFVRESRAPARGRLSRDPVPRRRRGLLRRLPGTAAQAAVLNDRPRALESPPEGTAAMLLTPLRKVNSATTVGFPRESRHPCTGGLVQGSAVAVWTRRNPGAGLCFRVCRHRPARSFATRARASSTATGTTSATAMSTRS
jgi:hypothetical protein